MLARSSALLVHGTQDWWVQDLSDILDGWDKSEAVTMACSLIRWRCPYGGTVCRRDHALCRSVSWPARGLPLRGPSSSWGPASCASPVITSTARHTPAHNTGLLSKGMVVQNTTGRFCPSMTVLTPGASIWCDGGHLVALSRWLCPSAPAVTSLSRFCPKMAPSGHTSPL